MTKILILNAGWSNKGNRALVESTVEAINMFTQDTEFNLIGPEIVYNDKVKICKQPGSLSIQIPRDTIESVMNLFKCCCVKLFKKCNVQIHIPKNSQLYHYCDCDIVVNSGGDILSGENGVGVLRALISISYAILLDKPVVLYGESLGYYRNPVINSIAKSVFNRTKLIIVREELSEKYLVRNRVVYPKIYVTADPAFALSVISKSRVYQILSDEKIDDIQGPLIGINPSGLIMTRKKEEFSKMISEVIDHLEKNLNATIILIPHVYTEGSDDRIVISSIFDNVKNKSRVKIVKNEYTPQELKGIIGLCDLFVGSRMHATIASTSMIVPTVGIAYSHKMHGIIGKMLGQEKYIIGIEKLNRENLISVINDAWHNRENIKQELNKIIPIVKEKSISNGKLVNELIEKM